MKTLLLLFLVFVLFTSCATNDFKVVDALRKGLNRREANSVVESYGFKLSESSLRPTLGWPKEDSSRTFINLPGRAIYQEEQLGIRISRADYYPVGHGLFGFGQLFLFYDTKGRLAEFYRYQIN